MRAPDSSFIPQPLDITRLFCRPGLRNTAAPRRLRGFDLPKSRLPCYIGASSPVAQQVEQAAVNRWVAGSSPARGAIRANLATVPVDADNSADRSAELETARVTAKKPKFWVEPAPVRAYRPQVLT